MLEHFTYYIHVQAYYVCIVQLGREEPAMSMDSSGKIIWAKHSEIQQANIKAIGDQDVKDGERLPLAVKDMGSCEIYPQTVAHNPNGRSVCSCGLSDTVYTVARNQSINFGLNNDKVLVLCYRFVVVCGDGEYIIYTAMALRNKSFGSAQEFVWGSDSSMYATRESTSSVKIFKNFKGQKAFKPEFGAEGKDENMFV